ncbi:MAG TPA: cell wall-binding repeat-containing protein, partial [Nonomuraea sp.]|nr:cell wall-binding repeat-containing protein [Nonomuraea sp.]
MLHRLRAPAVLLVVAMAAVLIPFSSPVASVPNVRTERIGGDDRYETAARIARSTFSQADTALLASGQNFPDALAGAALAGVRSAPVLLTQPNALPGSTRDALQTLQVKDVLILGGPAAVGESVRATLISQGYNVTRIEGANRYGTAAEVARRVALSGIGSLNGKRTAFLASGQNFPDALAAGPLAYVGRHPVLLTPTGSLAAETAAALRDLQIQHVVILGGVFAV